MTQEYENVLKRAKSLMGDNLFSEDDLARTLLQIAALTSERDRLREALRKLILSLNDHHTVHDLNIDVLYAIRDGNSLLDKDKS